MNYIDQNFAILIRYLETQSYESLFDKMKDRYLRLPLEIQNGIEDYFEKFPYWGKINAQKQEYEHIAKKAQSLKEHLADYDWLYHHLEDYRSKKLLLSILQNYYYYDFDLLGEMQEKNYSDYFDLDLIQPTMEEVLVDLGAYTGDTILDFLKIYGEDCYQKIYCYEIATDTFQTLQHNLAPYAKIECRQKAVSDHSETLYIEFNENDASANTVKEQGTTQIPAVSLDEDITDCITMLKMDIEGSEQKALRGSKNHIQREQPTLLLSVYHNLEDLWKIPKMIEEMQPGYHFYLRNHGGNIYPTEITLLAIYPSKEKKVS